MVTLATKLCVSIAQFPGNVGTTIHNALYARHGFDFVYKALEVKDEIAAVDAIRGVRALGIRGCGVSMPYKMIAAQMADKRSPIVESTGVANTLVNEDGILHAHNTDYDGVVESLKRLANGHKFVDVLIIGSGATAATVYAALVTQGFARPDEIGVVNIRREHAMSFACDRGAKLFSWDDLGTLSADLVINTTCLGMLALETLHEIPTFNALFDVVNRETALYKHAIALGKPALNGELMTAVQALKQFQLYTGKEFHCVDDFSCIEDELDFVLGVMRGGK